MVKILALIVIIVFTLGFYFLKPTGFTSKNEVSTPQEMTTTPETLGSMTTKVVDTNGWNTFFDEELSILFKHPKDLFPQKVRDSLEINKDYIQLKFYRQDLMDSETVNTRAEKDIDEKRTELGSDFELIETISPIAIGRETAVTYTLKENGLEINYFYIPQGNKFIKVINSSKLLDSATISLVDNIIYSVESQ